MAQKGLIFIWLLSALGLHAQVQMPDIVAPSVANQILMWDGSKWALRQLTGMTINSTQVAVGDNSSTNEGLLTLSGNSNNGSVTLQSNTTGNTTIKIVGAGKTTVTKASDTLRITTPISEGVMLPVTQTTVSNTTMTYVPNVLLEADEGNISFEIYVMYTTGAVGQGIQFRINSDHPARGTFWYDYNFPINNGRVSGIVYNSNQTITTASTPSGTNIGIIRGIANSPCCGQGIFDLRLQVAAIDNSSTVTVLSTTGARIR